MINGYIKEFFFLNEEFCERLRKRKAEFGYDGFGEIVFYRTYSRSKSDGSNESWADVVIRVIQGCLSIRKDWYSRNFINWDEKYWQTYAEHMAIAMFKMEWIPPGRGLWAMGTDFVYERGSMALNNCFAGTTKFFNNGKLCYLDQCVGKEVLVNTAQGLKKATVEEFGEQMLYNITFKPVRNNGKSNTKHRIVYQATREHRWILSDGSTTHMLKVKDRVKVTPSVVSKDTTEYKEGFVHGLIFADGCNHYKNKYRISLYGWKQNYRQLIENSKHYSHTIKTEDNIILDTEVALKECPQDQSQEYKQGFVDGWKLFDGHWEKTNYCLDTINEAGVHWLKSHSGYLDYVVIGHSVETSGNNYTNGKDRKNPLHRVKLVFEEVEFAVDSIIYAEKKEKVYCVVEPETESFMLQGGIITRNCAFVKLKSESLGQDFDWMMDALMLGVGVGFEPTRDGLQTYIPTGTYPHVITDDREGWANSVRLLVDAFTKPNTRKPVFQYHLIREAGKIIKGFGGKASGPAPLMRLHELIEAGLRLFHEGKIDEVELKADIANQIGVCVVAGNVRRSAELCQGPIGDATFLDLKRNPRRAEWMWMSNNSVILDHNSDFAKLHEVANRVIERGEPGILNLRNFPIGRVGKKNKGLRRDMAEGLNPCGEITLEDYELCNLVETCPTRCRSTQDWLMACKFATLYASTVSLLPTHRPETNRVVSRNRRIGVGIIDWTGWVHQKGLHNVVAHMRQGYKVIRSVNETVNAEAGVPASIKVTTMKPGGSVPKLPGLTSGLGYPTFKHTLRRMRVSAIHPMVPLLKKAGYPWEPEKFDPKGTLVFSFPILQGPAAPATEISLWEQAVNLVTLQREWADNAVSNTLYFRPKWQLVKDFYNHHDFRNWVERHPNEKFKHWVFHGPLTEPVKNGTMQFVSAEVTFNMIVKGENVKVYKLDPAHEEDQILKVLAAFAPLMKSCSLLPHTAAGVYEQTPEEGITEAEYERLKGSITRIDWSNYRGSDGQDEKYCQGDQCELPIKVTNG